MQTSPPTASAPTHEPTHAQGDSTEVARAINREFGRAGIRTRFWPLGSDPFELGLRPEEAESFLNSLLAGDPLPRGWRLGLEDLEDQDHCEENVCPTCEVSGGYGPIRHILRCTLRVSGAALPDFLARAKRLPSAQPGATGGALV